MGEKLSRHFVAAFQQVGQFQVTNEYRASSSKDSARLRKRGGNLVSYFCTPDGRILHFVVGAVSGNTLLEAADWAVARRPPTSDRDPAADLAERHRGDHWEALPADLREAFAAQRAKEKLPAPPPVERLVELALDAQIQLLTSNQPAKPYPVVQNERYWSAIAGRQVAGALPHLILSQRPLADLDAVSKPIFESLAGETFNPYDQRNAHLAEQVRKNIEDRVPTLLVIEAQIDPKTLPGGTAVGSSLPTSRSVQRHLESVRVVSLSSDELTWLLADLDQPAIAVRRGASLQFVVLNAQGERMAALTDKTPISVLGRFLAQAVETAPPR